MGGPGCPGERRLRSRPDGLPDAGSRRLRRHAPDPRGSGEDPADSDRGVDGPRDAQGSGPLPRRGHERHLTKPFVEEVLRETLERWLGGVEAAEPERPSAPAEALPPLDGARVMELQGLGRAVGRDVLSEIAATFQSQAHVDRDPVGARPRRLAAAQAERARAQGEQRAARSDEPVGALRRARATAVQYPEPKPSPAPWRRSKRNTGGCSPRSPRRRGKRGRFDVG